MLQVLNQLARMQEFRSAYFILVFGFGLVSCESSAALSDNTIINEAGRLELADTIYLTDDILLIQKEGGVSEVHINPSINPGEEKFRLELRDTVLLFTDSDTTRQFGVNGVKLKTAHALVRLVPGLSYYVQRGVLSLDWKSCLLELHSGSWQTEDRSCLNQEFIVDTIVLENNPATIGSESEQLFKIVKIESRRFDFRFLEGSFVKLNTNQGYPLLNPLYLQATNVKIELIEDLPGRQFGEYHFSGFVLDGSGLMEYTGDQFNSDFFNASQR